MEFLRQLIEQLSRPRKLRDNYAIYQLRPQIAMELKPLRRDRGYTQEDVAFLADVHRSSVVKLEGGFAHVNVDQLKKLLEAYETLAIEKKS